MKLLTFRPADAWKRQGRELEKKGTNYPFQKKKEFKFVLYFISFQPYNFCTHPIFKYTLCFLNY